MNHTESMAPSNGEEEQWKSNLLKIASSFAPLEADDKTESGIFLPESAKEKPMRGTVVAMGPGRLLDNGERVSPSVKSGDVVVYSKYAATARVILSTPSMNSWRASLSNFICLVVMSLFPVFLCDVP